ncbi:hypothetical protein I6H07_06320 [Hafnia alvei]|uniref:hypothetical protein n=1 Tax=Hafnia alvei TaxID=569 RepID=UPI000B6EB62E|nr:hypothetical protein [Hafnia alvei]MBI0275449.1 hypothetical protein [Hafnia alvei]PNK98557.1 hypothetical protein CEQ28_013670 [Hafnia alvei]
MIYLLRNTNPENILTVDYALDNLYSNYCKTFEGVERPEIKDVVGDRGIVYKSIAFWTLTEKQVSALTGFFAFCGYAITELSGNEVRALCRNYYPFSLTREEALAIKGFIAAKGVNDLGYYLRGTGISIFDLIDNLSSAKKCVPT